MTVAQIIEIETIHEHVRQGSRLLGLDLGTRTIGLALSDSGWMIASGLQTLQRKKFQDDAAMLRGLCAEHDVGALILGLPLNMNGSEGPRCQATRAFARNFGKLSALPIILWDERLSTAAVTRTLLEADSSRKRRSEVIDKLAATFILQGALDRIKVIQSQQPQG